MALSSSASNPWPRRLIVAAGLVLVPLFVFGGSVTTLRAGMAVTGWWNSEGSFMPFFPIDKWFRDVGTFVEHSHRLFGITLGLLMIAAVIATWVGDARKSARWLVVGALGAVCVQGYIGGQRVLENSPELAFLHGTISQLVIAVMAAAWVHQSAAWQASGVVTVAGDARLRRLAILTAVIVFVQIGIGAWYRHALRTGLEGNLHMRVGIHMLGALAVVGHVLPLCGRLKRAAAEAPGSPFGALRTALLVLLFVQTGLGIVAWMLAQPENVDFLQWFVATSHVVVGAAFLAWAVATAMWAHRTSPSIAISGAAR